MTVFGSCFSLLLHLKTLSNRDQLLGMKYVLDSIFDKEEEKEEEEERGGEGLLIFESRERLKLMMFTVCAGCTVMITLTRKLE